MQGLPRINMISLDLRESNEAPDLSSLYNYIERHYNENSENYKESFKEFINLRNMCLSGSENLNCLANMKRYYCQLQMLKARFPLSSNANCTVAWSWEDSNSNTTISLTDIRFEEASILYNIGCLHCNLGAKESRIDLDTTKVACTHFQCSAWAFQTILDKYTPLSVADLECDLLRYLNLLLLAEAHECVLEKSMVDQRRAGITAKIAFQISDFYKQCQGLLKSENIGYAVNSRHYMTWKRMCNLKEHLYYCLSYYYMGLVAEEANKYGDIIAWLKLAKEKLDNCWKPLKKLKIATAEETIKFVQDVINGKLESSIKDNNFIYYEKIPEPDMLPPIKGAMLLKGIGFDVNDPDLCGKDIFRNLIPMETHFSASVYSEKKAEILRQIQSEVESKNETMQNFLINMEWDNDIFSLADAKPPQELFNCSAFVSANSDVLITIKNTMQVISSICIEVEESLELLSNKIKSAEIDKSLPSWKQLEQDYVEFVHNFEDAKESNTQLRDAFACTLNDFTIMQKPMEDVLRTFPSLKEFSEDEESQKLLGETKRLLGKVEEMNSQRSELLQQLKTQMMEDDLTHLLLGCKLDTERNKTIEEGLKKHNELIDYLRQNMTAQSNIMDAIVEHNAKIADTKLKIMKVKEERENIVSRIVRSFTLYKNILKKGEEGIDFYRKLSDRVIKQHKELDKIIKPKAPELQTVETSVVNQIPQMEVSHLPSVTSITDDPLTISNTSTQLKSKFEPVSFNNISGFTCSTYKYQAPLVYSQNTQPRLKDYLKERKESSSLSSAQQYSNFNPSQLQYIPWGFYGPPSAQTAFTPNYSVSKSKIQDSEFRTTQNIYAPALASEIGTDHSTTSGYPNYSSLPRTNYSASYSQPPFNTSLNSASSIGSLTNNTGFTIPYQRNSFDNPNVISMAHGFGTFSIPGSKNQSMSNEMEKHQYCSYPYTHEMKNSTKKYFPTSVMGNNITSSTYGESGYETVAQQQRFGSYSQDSHSMSNTGTGNDVGSGSSHLYSGANSVQSSMAMGHLVHNMDSFSTKYQSDIVQSLPTHNNPYSDSRNMNVHQINIPVQTPASTLAHYSEYYINKSMTNNFQSGNPSSQMLSSSLYDNYNQSKNFESVPIPSSFIQSQQIYLQHQIGDKQNFLPSSLSSNKQQQPLQPQQFDHFSGPNNNASVIVATQQQPCKVDRKSNTTDLLSSSPTNGVTKDNYLAVLEPKILTKEEIKDQQEEKRKQIYHKQNSGSKHPLNDPLVLNRFIADAERFLKKINDLLDPTNNSVFELHWNNLIEKERNLPKKSTAIAKCSPMKNRFQDSVPYDDNRVIIKEGKDDYINASHILLQSIDECFPRFITLQSPLSNTVSEFWTAIFEQGCEILVQLATPCSGDNTSKSRVVSYWPDTKSKPLSVGSKFEISVQSFKEKSNWNERILLIKHLKTNQSRSVWHFQVNNVNNKLPKSLDEFLAFEIELCRSYRQQRSLTKPIGVSCINGSSVCGLFILLTTALLQMEVTGTFPDIDGILLVLWPQRKTLIEDKHQLAFVYKSVSKASGDILSKRNIVIGPGRNTLSSQHNAMMTESQQSSHGIIINSTSTSVVSSSTMIATVPMSTNSILDSIFSNHHLQISDLDSVLSKWNVKIDENSSIDNSSVTCRQSNSKNPLPSITQENRIENELNQDNIEKQDDEQKPRVQQEDQSSDSLKKITQLPSKLVHLQDPYSIDFTPTPVDKRKMTKKEFEAKLNNTFVQPTTNSVDCFDPLKALDPIQQLH